MPANSVMVFASPASEETTRPSFNNTSQMGQCQSFVSNNCYYGYHQTSSVTEDNRMDVDMQHHTKNVCRKRSANYADVPQFKRIREEIRKQRSKINESLNKKNRLINNVSPRVRDTHRDDDLFDPLLWHTHGCIPFQMMQCL